MVIIGNPRFKIEEQEAVQAPEVDLDNSEFGKREVKINAPADLEKRLPNPDNRRVTLSECTTEARFRQHIHSHSRRAAACNGSDAQKTRLVILLIILAFMTLGYITGCLAWLRSDGISGRSQLAGYLAAAKDADMLGCAVSTAKRTAPFFALMMCFAYFAFGIIACPLLIFCYAMGASYSICGMLSAGVWGAAVAAGVFLSLTGIVFALASRDVIASSAEIIGSALDIRKRLVLAGRMTLYGIMLAGCCAAHSLILMLI